MRQPEQGPRRFRHVERAAIGGHSIDLLPSPAGTVMRCGKSPLRIVRIGSDDAHIVTVFGEPPRHIARVLCNTDQFRREVQGLNQKSYVGISPTLDNFKVMDLTMSPTRRLISRR